MWIWAEHLAWQSSVQFMGMRQAKASFQQSGDTIESAESPAAKKFRELAEPAAKAKAKADMERPPFEFLRGQIAPFDVLPYYKQNHWMMMTVEARSSREDFKGSIRSQPLSLFGSQKDIIYGRPVSMDRNTPTRMSFPLFVPPRYMPQKQGKIFDLDLYRNGGLRPTEIWQTNVRAMEPHQMVVLVLARDPSIYNGWSKLMAGIPSSITRDSASLERGRYYRFVIPENPEKPMLAPSFLFWTSISHIIWDSFDPNLLDVDQQRAMLDWLHWGGQITIIGGADSRLGLLRESFLAPFLPADTGGTNRQLDSKALKPLAEAYRPPFRPTDTLTDEEEEIVLEDEKRAKNPEWAVSPGPDSLYYEAAKPILTLAKSPVFLTGLRPRPEASIIPLGTDKQTIMAAEWRVGRGRITMMGINPVEPSLNRWRGIDTLVRRLILRRPEESRPPPRALSGNEPRAPIMSGPELSWLRIGARDTGGPDILAPALKEEVYSYKTGATSNLEEDAFPDQETATWIDTAILPKTARDVLETASGITIPPISFVAKTLIIYLILLVPLNWLIFRSLNRKEWAWIANPFLALICALSVERLAAYDLGFTRGRDEIALLEMQSEYSRGHLTRFGALAATGRDTFQMTFPNDLNAVCLPLAYSSSRADEREKSRFDFMPVPALSDFRVQPRSLSYYRSEQMIGLPGPIRMVENEGKQIIENRTRLTLHNVIVLGPDNARFDMGDIGAGESKNLNENSNSTADPATSRSEILGKLKPEQFQQILLENPLKCSAEAGSWRLIAWSESMIEGVEVTPLPDRVRGFTLVLAHLKSGPVPDISKPEYDFASNVYRKPTPPAIPSNRSRIWPGMADSDPVSKLRKTNIAPPLEEQNKPGISRVKRSEETGSRSPK
jgi:hypothetical protein